MKLVYKVVCMYGDVMGSVVVSPDSRYFRKYAIGRKTKGARGAPLLAFDRLEDAYREYSPDCFKGGKARLLKCVATRPHRIPKLFLEGKRSFVSPPYGGVQQDAFDEFFEGNAQGTMDLPEGTTFCGSIFPVEEVQ